LFPAVFVCNKHRSIMVSLSPQVEALSRPKLKKGTRLSKYTAPKTCSIFADPEANLVDDVPLGDTLSPLITFRHNPEAGRVAAFIGFRGVNPRSHHTDKSCKMKEYLDFRKGTNQTALPKNVT